MNDLPILMSGKMVRAILNDEKTQTRRIARPQPVFTAAAHDSYEWFGGPALRRVGYGASYVHSDWPAVRKAMLATSRFQPGRRLWVRETWGPCDGGFCYAADEGDRWREVKPDDGRWHPGIHMPRWASRLNLEVTFVNVERLQDITAIDCINEGIPLKDHKCGCEVCSRATKLCPATCSSLIMAYADLWNSINAKTDPGFSFECNPFVWVVTFKKLHCVKLLERRRSEACRAGHRPLEKRPN